MDQPINALARVVRFYQEKRFERPLERDLAEHLHHGYVLATPEVFAMGRPVRHDAPERELLDIRRTFEDPDCWFVWAAAVSAGHTLAELLARLPFWLPMITFHRIKSPTNRLHIYPMERFEDLAQRSTAV